MNVNDIDLEAGLDEEQIAYVQSCIKLEQMLQKEIILAGLHILNGPKKDIVYTKLLLHMLNSYLKRSKE